MVQYDIQGDVTMTLKQTRLVTTDVAKLTQFYECVSQSKAEVLNSSYVQFQNEACKGLAIVELASTRAYGGHDKIGATAYANLDKKGT